MRRPLEIQRNGTFVLRLVISQNLFAHVVAQVFASCKKRKHCSLEDPDNDQAALKKLHVDEQLPVCVSLSDSQVIGHLASEAFDFLLAGDSTATEQQLPQQQPQTPLNAFRDADVCSFAAKISLLSGTPFAREPAAETRPRRRFGRLTKRACAPEQEQQPQNADLQAFLRRGNTCVSWNDLEL
jgi:hypothetical protein